MEGKIKASLAAAALLFFMMALASCSCSGGKGIKKGMTVTVNQRCIVAYDEDSYKKMTDYCTAKDERGLELMEAGGLIEILYTGATGTVTDMSFGKYKIRLLSNDKEVWIAKEFVDPV